MFWLMVTPTIGVIISSLFNFPDYLGHNLALTFGRLRPVHVNGVIMGAFSNLFIGECYYLVPRVCGVRTYRGELGVPLAFVWNIALMAGLIALPFGDNHGLEAGELPLFSEIPIFIVTSMLLIIPVWTVLVNFFGTVKGRWSEFGKNLPAKFLIIGSIMYLLGCFQGSLEALRSIQQPTHFSDFVISHSHLTVFGTFVIWAIGGLVYLWPRVWGREQLWSFTLGNWSFWLITLGISTMGLVLTAAGLQQGFEWMNGTEWVDTVVRMKPYWMVRTFSGVSMDIGMSLLVINLMMTALARPAADTQPMARHDATPLPAGGPAE